MKKDPSGKWILERNDYGKARQMYLAIWHESGELGGVGIWFEVFKGLLKNNKLEIKDKE